MVSDDERREVAQNMRDGVKSKTEFELLSLNGSSSAIRWLISYVVFGDKKYHSGVDLMNRLADLIEPDEPKVKCVAEVKVDGEQLEKLVHDVAVEYAGVDREALLALAEEMQGHADGAASGDGFPYVNAGSLWSYADRIRELCGEADA